MTKFEFAQAIATAVNGEAKEAEKTNGVKKTGICVGTGNIRPNICIDEMYDEGLSVEEATKQVSEMAERYAVPDSEFDVNRVYDYRVAKDMLELRLYNNKTNAEVFQSAAKYGYDDLILVPYIRLSDEASIKVTNDLLDMWDMDADEVIDDAMESTRKKEFKIQSLRDIFIEMMGEEMASVMVPPIEDGEEEKQYFVGNSKKAFGAIGAIVLKDEFNKRFPNGYYILPSSIHEVLLMPKSCGMNKTEIDDMVNAVTNEQVAPEDVLGWHCYEFKGVA